MKNPRPKTQNPNPKTQDPNLEIQNPEPQPQTQNPEPQTPTPNRKPQARDVRVYTITSSYGYAGGSFGLVTCEAPCKREHLDWRLSDQSLRSVTGGASLDAAWSTPSWDSKQVYPLSTLY